MTRRRKTEESLNADSKSCFGFYQSIPLLENESPTVLQICPRLAVPPPPLPPIQASSVSLIRVCYFFGPHH